MINRTLKGLDSAVLAFAVVAAVAACKPRNIINTQNDD
jgi:hypothetical protein